MIRRDWSWPDLPAIDVHCHTITPTFFAEMQRVAQGSSRFAEAARRIAQYPRVCGDPQMIGALDERVALLDAAKIDTQIISPGLAPSTYFDSLELSADVARSINDELSSACRGHLGRYRFFATLPLSHVQPSVDELQRAARLVRLAAVTESFASRPRFQDSPSRLASPPLVTIGHPRERE